MMYVQYTRCRYCIDCIAILYFIAIATTDYRVSRLQTTDNKNMVAVAAQ